VRAPALALAAALGTLVPTLARAQQGAGARPNEQDMFGGAPAAGAPAPASSPSSPTPSSASPGGGTERDRALLDEEQSGVQHLSDYQAPENPLQIGGQLYLRAQSSARQGQSLDAWSLTAPSLLDVYLDARPNPRVRAFILGRMSTDPTAAPGGTGTALPGGSGGAFSGGSATGFTTFNAARGPNAVLDQMWIRFDLRQRVFVTAGKQHVRWGTGRFWQPTDYLHPIKRNPLDVFDARAGVTMLKLHVPWEARGWNFYGFGVFEDPNQPSNTLRRVAGGARAELVIADAELGLDVLVKADQKPRYGIDLSTGIWEFDVYADVGIRSGQDFNVVHRVTDPNAGVLCDPAQGLPAGAAVKDLSAEYAVAPLTGVKTQAVGGINWAHKYNDNDLFTIGAEYFYNQPGYDDPSLYPGLLFNSSNTPMLNFFYTGRHYGALFASFPAPYDLNRTTFTLSTLGNLTDQSFISRLDYGFTLLTHLSLEAFLGVHYGHEQGEFRLGFDIPTQYRVQQPAPPAGTPPLCDVIPGLHFNPALIDVGVALRLKI
jgi:hypothetical protein